MRGTNVGAVIDVHDTLSNGERCTALFTLLFKSALLAITIIDKCTLANELNTAYNYMQVILFIMT